MGRIGLVAFDLDGTVLDEKNSPRPASLETVRRLLTDGIEVASISGRSVSKSQFPFELHGLADAMHVGSYNGAVALQKAVDGGRKVLLEQRLPEDLFRDAACRVREGDMNLIYCDLTLSGGGVRETYHTLRRDSTIVFMATQTGTDFAVDPDLLDRIETGDLGPPPKIIVLPGLDRRDETCEAFRARYEDRLYIAWTDVDRIELMHPEVDKAVALSRIAEGCGVPLSETLAVGDGENDLPMLRAAGVGALMGNAHERVRAQAGGNGIVDVPDLASDGFSAAVDRYVYGG